MGHMFICPPGVINRVSEWTQIVLPLARERLTTHTNWETTIILDSAFLLYRSPRVGHIQTVWHQQTLVLFVREDEEMGLSGIWYPISTLNGRHLLKCTSYPNTICGYQENRTIDFRQATRVLLVVVQLAEEGGMNEFASSGECFRLISAWRQSSFHTLEQKKARERRELRLWKETAQVYTHFEFRTSTICIVNS